MTMIWADSFSAYGLGNANSANVLRMLNGLYAEGSFGPGAQTGLVADPDPSGTGAPVLQQFDNGYLRKTLGGPKTTAGVAFRLWIANLPDGDNSRPTIARFQSAANDTQCYICVDSTGTISAYVAPWVDGSNVGGTLIGTSATEVIVANAWQHVETWATIGTDGNGSIEVRVNGVTALSFDNVRTQPAPPEGEGERASETSQIIISADRYVYNSGISPTCYFRDLVMCDNLGTENNAFLGTVSVFRLIPNADRTLGGWTLTGGATGSAILDAVPPIDADYISAAIPPISPAQFDLTDLPVDVTSVKGVVSVVRARNIDGGDGSLQVSVLSAAEQADGSSRPITSAFTYWVDVFEVDPATDAPFTPGAVNALGIQLNRTV